MRRGEKEYAGIALAALYSGSGLNRCLILLAGCSLNPSASGAGKTLTVATEPAFPPFEFQAQGGELLSV